MNPIEDIFITDGYRVEVRKSNGEGYYVHVFTKTGDYPIARGMVIDNSRQSVERKARDMMEVK